ncbi:GGDEF domain-containing protein [Corallincola luteus]|uniref:diguanylate cyclase n=2 Tax=Corallincola TaxID=1775176 RepID=A0ABY1WSC6_9GAMM|nr:GGDEF domain-containing protein [Corallincola spongiicola]TCI05157.1 GGDEF domain-containing protein [Corallincola luteus]
MIRFCFRFLSQITANQWSAALDRKVVVLNTPNIPADEKKRLAALKLATIDELTGTGNRLGFIFLAQHMLNLCARQGAPATLVCFELNNLNGVEGAPQNLHTLKLFAEQMRKTFRVSDMTARMSSNQFVVLLTNTPLAHAELVLEKFHEHIAAIPDKADMNRLSFSAGIAGFFPNRSTEIEDLITEATAQIYPHHLHMEQRA